MASTKMFRRFVGPLTEKELNQFLEENARFGEVFGLSPALLPQTGPQFEDYWQSMIEGPLLGSHRLCGEVARAVVCPEAPWTMRLLSPVFRELSLKHIPASLCERLGVPALSSQSRSWKTLDHTLPWLRQMAPPSLRYAPQYVAARRRLDLGALAS